MEKNSSHIGRETTKLRQPKHFFVDFFWPKTSEAKLNHLGIHPSETVPAALPHYELVFDKWGSWRDPRTAALRYRPPGKRGNIRSPVLKSRKDHRLKKWRLGDVLILGSVPSSVQSMSQFMRQVEFSRKDLSTFMIGGSRMVIDHLMSYTS